MKEIEMKSKTFEELCWLLRSPHKLMKIKGEKIYWKDIPIKITDKSKIKAKEIKEMIKWFGLILPFDFAITNS